MKDKLTTYVFPYLASIFIFHCHYHTYVDANIGNHDANIVMRRLFAQVFCSRHSFCDTNFTLNDFTICWLVNFIFFRRVRHALLY